MCGRFTLETDREDLIEAFGDLLWPERLEPRYNIAPTQPVLAITNTGERAAGFLQWGLIPSWAKDPAIGNRMINARAETLAEKPSFRNALRRRRCLIPADGFYEWRPEPGNRLKTPMYIRLRSGRPFAFAGLWEIWQPPDGGELRSCTIITTEPNALLEPIHNRMPVILDPGGYERWLDPTEQPPEHLSGLLKPYPAEEMTAHAVTRRVNNPKVDDKACIESAE